MHFLLGVRTEKFVILAADKDAFAHGAIAISDEYKKEIKLGEKTYMTCIGETGDVDDFGNWTQANLRLYKTRNGRLLACQSSSGWIRRLQAKAFLSSIDYLGNGIADQNYLFSGFPGRFCYSIMDSLYKSDMNQEEALVLLHKCLAEAKKRVIVNFSTFTVLVIDKDGTQHLPDIKV